MTLAGIAIILASILTVRHSIGFVKELKIYCHSIEAHLQKRYAGAYTALTNFAANQSIWN